jgi:hypothetical protein
MSKEKIMEFLENNYIDKRIYNGIDVQTFVSDLADLLAFLDTRSRAEETNERTIGLLKRGFDMVYQVSASHYLNQEFEKLMESALD